MRLPGDDQDILVDIQKPLFGSTTRGPAAQWDPRLASLLSWNNIRDNFVHGITDN